MKSARLELWLVAATAGLHLLFQHVLGFHAFFVIGAVTAVVAYVVVRGRTEPGLLSELGFTTQNLAPAFAITTAWFVVAMSGMALIAHERGHLRLHPHIGWGLVFYPLWGVVQQLLVQGFVARNLAAQRRIPGGRASIALLCATLFGLLHAPHRELVIATFLLGVTFTAVYLRYRNLWPLGLYHGWLGLFFYFWVHGKNPLGGFVRAARLLFD